VLPADARERPRVREGENGGEHRQAAHDDEGASGVCGSEEREAQVGRVIGGSEERGVQDGVCVGEGSNNEVIWLMLMLIYCERKHCSFAEKYC
jgi:hypothetical protein